MESLLSSNIELTLLRQLILDDPQTSNEKLIAPSLNWSLFYTLIHQHRVWHQVQSTLTRRALITPINKPLAQQCRRDALRIFKTASETIKIAQIFNQQQITHCFVKGVVLNAILYESLISRPCKDIDIWVDEPHYETAISLLLEIGYQQSYPQYSLKGFKKAYYLTHKHDIAFYHPKRQILIELHFQLNYGVNSFAPSPIMLRPLDIMKTKVMTLENDYHLLFLMIHGGVHGWMRLRWLNDIALFIQQKRCDLPRVIRLAQALNCFHLVEQAFILVYDLLGVSDEAYLTLIQKPSRRTKRLTGIVKRFLGMNYTLADVGIKSIKLFFLYRIYLGHLANPGHKRQAVLNDLFKIDLVFEYVTFPKSLTWLYYLLYPFVLLKYLLKIIDAKLYQRRPILAIKPKL